MITGAQALILRDAILADQTLSGLPNNPDNNTLIANAFNLNASPDFYVWRTSVPVEDVQNAIVYANMTPAQVPDGTQLWANRAFHAQGKQFNLQNLMLGRDYINPSKANVRTAFQDCLTGLPTKADGTNQAAGWVSVEATFKRLATRGEKLYATGGNGAVATPASLTFEGQLSYEDVEFARSL